MEQQNFKYNANINLISEFQDKSKEENAEILSINHLSPVVVKFKSSDDVIHNDMYLLDIIEERVYQLVGSSLVESTQGLSNQIKSIIKDKKTYLKQKVSSMQSQADDLVAKNNSLAKGFPDAKEFPNAGK